MKQTNKTNLKYTIIMKLINDFCDDKELITEKIITINWYQLHKIFEFLKYRFVILFVLPLMNDKRDIRTGSLSQTGDIQLWIDDDQNAWCHIVSKYINMPKNLTAGSMCDLHYRKSYQQDIVFYMWSTESTIRLLILELIRLLYGVAISLRRQEWLIYGSLGRELVMKLTYIALSPMISGNLIIVKVIDSTQEWLRIGWW